LVPELLGQPGPLLPLAFATLLLLVTAVDMRRDHRRPLWMRLALRIIVFAGLTWLLQHAVGSPIAPDFHPTLPGEKIWGQLVQIGWWMLGARVAVGIVRLVVVLENRPRETQIVSDLLAGALYTATALAVINFVFAVPIAGLVATSGVVAIVLGLALQSTLSDVFSGIAVGLEHAYKPGDMLWVEGGVEGQVLQINWRSTQIATPHNSIAIVPNSIMAKSRLENRSAPTPTRGITITISTDAAVDPRRCLAVLDAAVKACRLPLPQPAPVIDCVGLRGDGVAYDISFAVAASGEIAAVRTEILSQVHRHLRHAGIALGITGIATPPRVPVPTLGELLAESDVFGALTPEERTVLAGQFILTSRKRGETLLCKGEEPEAVFLLTAGTAEMTTDEGGPTRVLLRASPGDSVGMIALIIGGPSQMTATALTALEAYRLDKTGIAAAMRERPELKASLEVLAKRGLAWLRCEAAAHEDLQIERPGMMLSRVRQFLHRLNM
jgi:small-conductance mechanosensitive channel/CRP-like cAMP-binding protein